MSRPAKMYLVNGHQMTIREAAELTGASKAAIYGKLARSNDDLQTIVNLYRSNPANTRQCHGTRYFIDGEWLTVSQVAKRLGIRPGRLRGYLWRHRDAAGNWPPLSVVVEKYRRREIREHGGFDPIKHKIGNRFMTQAEIAASYGVKLSSFRVCVYRKGGVAQAIAFYEKKARERARDEILKILRI